MHDGCSGGFINGQAVVQKLRMMGFSQARLPVPFSMKCLSCGASMEMLTYEFACPGCGAVHGVTPCHAYSADEVQCAGVGF